MTGGARCGRCGGDVIRRNPVQLLTVGLIMCATLAIALWVPWFWIPGIILFLTGTYLIAWATLAKGMWCRQCKTFAIDATPGG